MPALIEVTSEDATGNNEHLDALLVLRACVAFDGDSAPTEAEVAAFAASPHRYVHLEADEPLDTSQPNETMVMFADLAPPSKLMFKFKDDVGAIKIGQILLT